jgi:hypothetical protein
VDRAAIRAGPGICRCSCPCTGHPRSMSRRGLGSASRKASGNCSAHKAPSVARGAAQRECHHATIKNHNAVPYRTRDQIFHHFAPRHAEPDFACWDRWRYDTEVQRAVSSWSCKRDLTMTSHHFMIHNHNASSPCSLSRRSPRVAQQVASLAPVFALRSVVLLVSLDLS